MTQPTLIPEPEASQTEPSAEAETTLTEPEKTSDEESAASAASAQPVEEKDEDDLAPVEREPYEFDQCTITVGLQFLPADGNPAGRQVLIGVRNHLDQPMIKAVRASELGPLSPVIVELLEQLKADLPARRQAFEKAKAEKQAEEEKRRARIASSKTSAPKSKAKRGKTNWNAAPSSAQPSASQTPAAPPPPASLPTQKPAQDEQSTQMLLFS